MAKTETQGDITDWLRGLGLEQYAQAFHDNAIDHEILRDLTAGDLIDLGVRLVGHRRKLLAAIAALRDHPPILLQRTSRHSRCKQEVPILPSAPPNVASSR
jgi:hypothetical protein